MKDQHRNTLTIAEAKDILCAEHAGKLFVAECWWAVVPHRPGSFAYDGDAGAFWSLITATLELGQPLGYEKVENKLRKLVSVAHVDPEKILTRLIKPEPRAFMPDRDIIKARCDIAGTNPDSVLALRRAAYDAECQEEITRVAATIRDIMRARPTNDDWQTVSTHLGDFDEESGEYKEFEIVHGEHLIPVDRVIEFCEKQLKYLAQNMNIPDTIFAAESTLWTSEIQRLAQIVQQREHIGSSEFNRELDDGMLGSAEMNAGMQAGK